MAFTPLDPTTFCMGEDFDNGSEQVLGAATWSFRPGDPTIRFGVNGTLQGSKEFVASQLRLWADKIERLNV